MGRGRLRRIVIGSRGAWRRRMAVALLLALPLSSVPRAAVAITTPKVVSTIQLSGGQPEALAVNAATNRVYVAQQSAQGTAAPGSVFVLDGATNTILAGPIAVGANSSGIAIDQTANRVYVVNNVSGTVSVIDGSSNSVAATVTVPGSNPTDVAFNPVTGRYYVTHNANVAVFDAATNALVTDVSLSSATSGVAVNPATNLVFVGLLTTSQVAVIDGGKNVPFTTTIAVGSSPEQIVVNKRTNKIYVANAGSASVSVIDGATGTVAATVGVGANPRNLAMDETRNELYVSNDGANSVSAVDTLTNTVKFTQAAGTFPTGIGVNPTTDTVYVANAGSDNVTVIGNGCTSSSSATSATVCVGGRPRGIAIDTGTSRAYVANFGDNTVSVIQLGAAPSAAAVVATIPVGAGPFGLAVDPGTHRVYVADQSSNDVTVIDGTTNAVIATVAVGSGPVAVAVGANHRVYVANNAGGGNAISVINGDPAQPALTVVATVTVATAFLQDLAYSTANGRLYAVTANGDTTQDALISLANDPTTNVNDLVAGTLPLAGLNPSGVAVNASTGQIWVSTNAGVSVFSDTDGLRQAFSVAAGTHERIAVNARPNRGYAPGGNSLTIVDGSSRAAGTRPVGNGANGVAVTDSGQILVSDFSDATVTVLVDGALTGVAECLTNTGDGIFTTLLPGSTVQLFSGPVLVATAQARAVDASYAFTGLAPLSPYDVRYSAVVSSVPVSCGVTVTTDAFGGGVVPPPQPYLNRKNHTWFRPYPLDGNPDGVTDVLTHYRQKTWYKLVVKPQQIVTVRLTNLPKDYTLTAYRDLRQVLAELQAQSGTLAGIQALNASLHDAAIDDIGIDDIGIDDIGIDDIGIDDIGIDDIGIDDIGIDDIGIDDIGIDDIGIGTIGVDDIGIDDIGIAISSNSTVERRGLRAISAHPGTADEVIRLRTRGYSGRLYFRVGGHGGVFDPGNQFRITATAVDADASCLTAPLLARTPSNPAVAGGYKTLILTNTSRLNLTGTTAAAFVGFLNTTLASRPEVNGVVVDLAADANVQADYADWSGAALTCVHEANAVADSIKSVVSAYRAADPIEYVVMVGGDLVVPFRRVPDRAELSREDRYRPPLDAASAGEASLGEQYVLTDNFYAAARPISHGGVDLWVPDLAIGRLVETASDVTAYVNAYVAASGVMVNAASGFSSGYDFLTDLANVVTGELGASGVTVNSSLVNNTWSADDVRAALLQGTARYGVISLEAHFSANTLVPANNGPRLLSTELDPTVLTDGRFKGTLVLSVGCHSGYNIQDPEKTTQIPFTQPFAFPEEFLRQGATLFGQTGYGYGDTLLVKNSEALMAKYAHELRFKQDPAGNAFASGVPVGKALVYAKRSYVNDLLAVRGIDEKVINEATIYGLPMFAVALPIRIDRPAGNALVTVASPKGTLGLSTADVQPTFTLQQHPANPLGGTPSFFDAGGGDLSFTQTIPARPILPRTVVDVHAIDGTGAPTLPRGAVLLSADFADGPFTPQLATPVTQDAIASPTTYLDGAFTPALPFRLNELASQTLVVTPMQYLSNQLGTGGTARVYGSTTGARGPITTRLYYSTRTGTAALTDGPAIANVALGATPGGKLHVDVTVHGLNDPAIEDVWVTFTGANAPLLGHWRSLRLAGGASTPDPSVNGIAGPGFTQHFTADLDPLFDVTSQTETAGTPDPTSLSLFVQAVSGVGAVSVAMNDGLFFHLVTDPTTATAPKAATRLALSGPATATYRSRITATAALTDANSGAPLANRVILFRLGSGALALTNAGGVATASLLVSAPPGAATLEASYAGDLDALPAGATAAVLVGPAPTSLVATGQTTVEYSDGIDVATLMSTATGAPLGDRPITITLGDGRAVATATDGLGRVRFDTLDFGGLGPGTYAVTLGFPGDGRYAAAAATYAVTVRPEKATAAFQGGPQPLGAVSVSAAVTQEADGSQGDITKATVTFAPLSDTGVALAPITAPVGPDGIATATFTGTPAGLYTVTLTVGGFFTGSGSGVVPVFDPARRVSGAGSIPVSSTSAGLFAFDTRYLPAPPVSPIAAPSGTLPVPAGVYGLGYTYVTALGLESALSMTSSVNVPQGDVIQVGAITGIPRWVVALNFYYTVVPGGGRIGRVATRNVVAGQVSQFTLAASAGSGVARATAPTGAFAFATVDKTTGLVNATFAVGTPGVFSWLVISGNPPNHAVFEFDGTLVDATGSHPHHARVTVDTPATGPAQLTLQVFGAGGFTVSGPVTPLPLDDNPTLGGIVFR